MKRLFPGCALLAGFVLPMSGCSNDSGEIPAKPINELSNATDTANDHDPPLPVAKGPKNDQITGKKLHALLKEKNPRYQGNAQFAPEGGPIVAVKLSNSNVTDLSPLAGMELQFLELANTGVSDLSPIKGMPLQALDLFKTRVSDLEPLRDMPLVKLLLEETAIKDISPLEGMPLKELWLNKTSISDISVLAKMPIEKLNLFDTKVKDLAVLQTLPLNTVWLRNVPATDFSPLDGLLLESLDVQGTGFTDKDLALIKGMPVQRLNIAETNVTDLTPLTNLQLMRLIFTPSRIKQGLEIIREMNSLRELDVTFREPNRLQPAEFWKRHAAGDFDESEE